METPEVPAEDNTAIVQKIKNRFSDTRCSAIRQTLNSLHRALKAELCCSCSPPHQAAVDLDWPAYEAGTDPSVPVKLAISFSVAPQTQPPHSLVSWRRLHVTTPPRTADQPVSPSTQPSQRPLTTSHSPTSTSGVRFRLSSPFKHLPVRSSLSRASSQTATPVSTSPAPDTTVTPATTIFSLCSGVCSLSSPWTLWGVIKDPSNSPQGREFAVDHSQAQRDITRTLALRTLVSPVERSGLFALTVAQRYSLAASAAWSVLHLAGSPWLESGWDNDQLRIFVEQGAAGPELLCKHPMALYAFTSQANSMPLAAVEFQDLIPNRAIFSMAAVRHSRRGEYLRIYMGRRLQWWQQLSRRIADGIAQSQSPFVYRDRRSNI